MTTGFFPSTLVKKKQEPLSLIAQCGACGLYKTCASPKMPMSGEGRKKILIITETPSKEDDDQNTQLVGQTGKKLRNVLDGYGIDLDYDCWKTNSLICRPPDNHILNDKEIEYCRPNLLQTLKKIKPNVIIPLGTIAVKSLIGWLWHHPILGIDRWVGWQIPSQQLNAWICPTYHPSYLLKVEKFSPQTANVIELWFKRHIKAAVDLASSPPWMAPPNYESRIEKIRDANVVAKALRQMYEIGDPIAFDYETDRLKPDSKDARIVCCAVAQKKRCISFPWHGKAINAMRSLLQSKIPKMGWHIKFENRWTRKQFGRGVRNWIHDGMLASHCIDNRPDITSIKFQSLVMLGQSSYNDVIAPYLHADNGNAINKIKQVDLDTLLIYCGMDAILALEVGLKQMEMLEWPNHINPN